MYEENAKIIAHAFYYVMPVAALLYHRELTFICQKREHRPLFILKCILYLALYGVMTVAFLMPENVVIKFVTFIMFIMVGGLTILYSYAIFNLKAFSKKIPSQEEG